MGTTGSADGVAVSFRFDDADAVATAIRDADVEYVPLQAGAYDTRLTFLRCGSIQIQWAVDRAHLTRGAVHGDRVGLLFADVQGTSAAMNGLSPDLMGWVLLNPGAELLAHCPAEQEWSAWSMPTETFDELTDGWRIETRNPAGGALFRDTAGTLTALRGRLRRMVMNRTTGPEAVATWAVGSRDIQDEIHQCLLAQRPGFVEAGHGRPITAEVLRLVRQAEAFLDAHTDQPIYSDDLCAALGVSARRLHNAFVTACGLSPLAYLKRRRLVMARRRLATARDEQVPVKAVALSYGFWHLSHFARDYRTLFGELPSDTWMRGQPIRSRR